MIMSLRSPSLMEFQTKLNEDLASQQVDLSDNCFEPFMRNNETTFATTDSLERSFLQDNHLTEQFFFCGSSSNLGLEKQTASLDPLHVYPHGIPATLHQCRQSADGYAVVMDNFQVGGSLTVPAIDKISQHDKSQMFFRSHQDVNLMKFPVPDEVSRTSDEYGHYKNDNMNMSKVASSSADQRTYEGCKRCHLSKGQWTAEEDWLLTQLVEQVGSRWSFIAEMMPRRTAKQCRERWHNHLRPNIKTDAWTEEEDKILIQAHAEMGNKWSEIAKRLPSRTQNSIKNHWNATKRRQYSKKKRRYKCPRSSLLREYIQSLNLSTSERVPGNSSGSDRTSRVDNNASASKSVSEVQPRPESDSCSSDDGLVRIIIDSGEVLELMFDEKLLQEGCTIDSLLDDLPCPPDTSVKDGGGGGGGGEEFGMEMLDMDLDLVEMITLINS